MTPHFLTIGLAWMTVALPANAEPPADPHVTAMVAAAQRGDPATAVAEADKVIAAFERQFHKPDTLYFCGQTSAETLMNMGLAATQKKDAIAVTNDWCDAHYIKGFSAIDLNKSAVAEDELRKATEMAPFNAHYLNEYAELFKSRREWQRSFDHFAKAADLASFCPEANRKAVEARSLRGMGFTKIELGDLDEAERLFKRSLKLTPNHPGTLSELKYISDRRAATP